MHIKAGINMLVTIASFWLSEFNSLRTAHGCKDGPNITTLLAYIQLTKLIIISKYVDPGFYSIV
jgi:hypothetical protein